VFRHKGHLRFWYPQWIGLRGNLQENPIFHGKIDGFLYIDFPLNQSIDTQLLMKEYVLKPLRDCVEESSLGGLEWGGLDQLRWLFTESEHVDIRLVESTVFSCLLNSCLFFPWVIIRIMIIYYHILSYLLFSLFFFIIVIITSKAIVFTIAVLLLLLLLYIVFKWWFSLLVIIIITTTILLSVLLFSIVYSSTIYTYTYIYICIYASICVYI